jgi:hypothetical protein
MSLEAPKDLPEKSDIDALRNEILDVTGRHAACTCLSSSAVAESVLSIADSVSNGEFRNDGVAASMVLAVADLQRLVDTFASDLLEKFDSSIAEFILSTKCLEDL